MALEVRGNQLLVEGSPFVVRGLIVEGLLLPLDDVTKCLVDYAPDAGGALDGGADMLRYCQRHLDSRDYLAGTGLFARDGGSADLLSLALADWQINTVRFNVLQVALDPASKYYQPSYLAELKSAVALARAKGLMVILALFDSPSNDDPYFKKRYPKLSLDDEVTEAAARTLAQTFGQDQKVMFELLNEPYLGNTAADARWLLWRDGGKVAYGPFANHPFVGVNRELATIRGSGARNAVILQAPVADFVGFPGGVVDPLNLVLYASHPFLTAGDDDNVDWALHFGEFARTHPYVMTAWNVSSDTSSPVDQWCAVRGPNTAQRYLNSLTRQGLGVVGFALDVNGSVVTNFQTKLDQPSKLSASCGPGGGGKILQQDFLGSLVDLGNGVPVLGSITAPASAHPGDLVSVTIVATDPEGDPLNYQVDWGDGAISPRAGELQTTPSFTHAFSSTGAKHVVVRVVDGPGAEVAGSVTVLIGT